jgi:hypothetical protein
MPLCSNTGVQLPHKPLPLSTWGCFSKGAVVAAPFVCLRVLGLLELGPAYLCYAGTLWRPGGACVCAGGAGCSVGPSRPCPEPSGTVQKGRFGGSTYSPVAP